MPTRIALGATCFVRWPSSERRPTLVCCGAGRSTINRRTSARRTETSITAGSRDVASCHDRVGPARRLGPIPAPAGGQRPASPTARSTRKGRSLEGDRATRGGGLGGACRTAHAAPPAGGGRRSQGRHTKAVMNSIPAGLRRLVVFRAGDRCEYCGLAQQGQEASFHADHIVPRAARGATTASNLALACGSCSLRKRSRRSGRDPRTGRIIPLFQSSPSTLGRPFPLGYVFGCRTDTDWANDSGHAQVEPPFDSGHPCRRGCSWTAPSAPVIMCHQGACAQKLWTVGMPGRMNAKPDGSGKLSDSNDSPGKPPRN